MYTLLTNLHIYKKKKFIVGLYYLVNIHNFPVKEDKFPKFWHRTYVGGSKSSETNYTPKNQFIMNE